jgi:hypothetical protein
MDSETQQALFKTLGDIERKINVIGLVVYSAGAAGAGWFAYHIATTGQGYSESVSLWIGLGVTALIGFYLERRFDGRARGF